MAALGEKCDPDARFKLLSNLADSVVVDHNIPPMRYFRSGVEMQRMAAVYLQEGNIESAFALYMKYIVLFVEKLPKHPHFRQADQAQVKKVLANVKKIFPITENLRKSIKELYEKDYKEWQEEERRKTEEEEEWRRKEEEKKEQMRKEEERERQEREQYMAQKKQQSQNAPTVVPISVPSAPSLDHDFPEAPKVEDLINDRQSIPDVPPPPYALPETGPYSDLYANVPDVRRRSELDDSPESNIPHIDRTTKPSSAFNRQVSNLVGGLRRIYLPQELVSRFLTVASENTARNLETCGILTGKLAKNVFHITHLVIPKQSATCDSCTTTNEEEMFDVQDKYDLVTLGWIHTHPSQTSFLSSVDLHTHYAYQTLMPEAIAIVCAPKFNQTGVYHITPKHGMSLLASCNKSGFHPHPKEPPLFEESEHTHMDASMGLKIVDLR